MHGGRERKGRKEGNEEWEEARRKGRRQLRRGGCVDRDMVELVG
jgi:hypothetical protein